MPAGQISVIAFDSEFNFAQPTPLPLTFVGRRGARAFGTNGECDNYSAASTATPATYPRR